MHMDIDNLKRRQSLKVIVSEAVMVAAVIVTVIVLALVVSGYWLNSNFEVERQGMLQISSVPTGAEVEIDGTTSWLQRTNMSKVLPVGEHPIILTKNGYDTWSKTISITEGLLYRLHYPRLFLEKREKEIVYDAIGTTAVFISSNYEKALLYTGEVSSLDITDFSDPTTQKIADTSETMLGWTLLELNSEKIEPKIVSLRTLYDFFREDDTPSHDSIKDFQLTQDLDGTEELIFSKFYEDHYLTILDDTVVTVYKRDNSSPVLEAVLTFLPDEATAGHNGEFVIFSAGSNIATLDMESLSVREWAVDGASFGWLDDDMIYSISDGELFVYDFDGLNRRSLARNVSERFPVFITNDKWLYYFSDDNLVREWLIAR